MDILCRLEKRQIKKREKNSARTDRTFQFRESSPLVSYFGWRSVKEGVGSAGEGR